MPQWEQQPPPPSQQPPPQRQQPPPQDWQRPIRPLGDPGGMPPAGGTLTLTPTPTLTLTPTLTPTLTLTLTPTLTLTRCDRRWFIETFCAGRDDPARGGGDAVWDLVDGFMQYDSMAVLAATPHTLTLT